MKTYVVEKTDDTVTLGLKNADMTIIQALMDTLNNIEDVLLVRYEEEHPDLEDNLLFVKVKEGGDPMATVKAAADKLSQYFAEIVS
ncbi:MAG TPA: RpoL/Rpb11 RNA polymerase subunit family protein [Candidatus Methanomethylophilaceae archaeon]|nr:RpoL/Rpb11 RNA polymerase subunit family protein [Candidatus Methanomethylophilaceae archaeon]